MPVVSTRLKLTVAYTFDGLAYANAVRKPAFSSTKIDWVVKAVEEGTAASLISTGWVGVPENIEKIALAAMGALEVTIAKPTLPADSPVDTNFRDSPGPRLAIVIVLPEFTSWPVVSTTGRSNASPEAVVNVIVTDEDPEEAGLETKIVVVKNVSPKAPSAICGKYTVV